MRGVQRSRIYGRSLSTSCFSPMELKIFTWSISMLVFPSEVPLKLPLRLERRAGPIAEVCEAVSPTFSSFYFRTKTGTANPNIRKDWSDTRNSRNSLTDTEEREKKNKKND